MWSYQRLGGTRHPPVWRTVLLMLLVAVGTLLSATYSPASWAMSHEDDGLALLASLGAFLAAILMPVSLIWRHRVPFSITGATALLPLLLPVGNTMALISLACLIGRRRGPAVRWMTGLVALTSTAVVLRDAFAQPIGASLLKSVINSGEPSAELGNAPVAAVVVFAVLGIGIAVGSGMLMRARREADHAQLAVQAERVTSEQLGDEVARRQERERIAREVHDVMGHRLSLLNLHAGALEANSTDPRVSESASLVRQSAGEAMSDLRSLLSVLREPMGSDPPDLPMERLPQVVEESFGAGQQLSSSIFIQDAEHADPTLSRAVYRIVQEVLTNARKHAPGEPVWLSVQGGPTRGVVIDAHNPYRGGWGGAPPGSLRGIAGIAERVELLGGKIDYGLAEGGKTFRIRVELPWRAAGRAGPP